MRVVLSRRRHEERGAIAIMMAVSVVMLCICGALVTDFGMAYVNKTQAQTAADAGALAAAKVYKVAKASCSTIAAGDTLKAGAFTQAEAVRAANMPNSKPGTLTVKCGTDGVLEVDYQVKADSPIGLGALVAGSDHLTVQRNAAVKYGTAAQAVGNLRPWMICGAQVPAAPYPSKVVAIGLPGNGHLPSDPKCTNPNKPGDWWRTSCFNGGGSHGDTEQNVLVGCSSVQIVPGQNPLATPAQRSTYLKSKCGPESTYCLADDTGRDVSKLDDEWATLLGKTIAMPVFCSDQDCSPTSVTKKGNWPVWKIAAVVVCGFALHGSRSADMLPSGECQSSNTSNLKPSTSFGDKDDIGFLLIFKGILESGGLASFPTQVDSTLRLVK